MKLVKLNNENRRITIRTPLLFTAIFLIAASFMFSGCNRRLSGIEITAYSVGKADAILVKSADSAVLIDTGETDDGDDILRSLTSKGIDKLDYLIVTHYDKDHIGGALTVAGGVDIEKVICPDYKGNNEEYENFMTYFSALEGFTRVSVRTEFSLGGMDYTVYPSDRLYEDNTGETDDNNMSLVIRVSYGDNRFLFTGDIEKKRISAMLDSGTDIGADWIKMPHHGDYKKNLADLLISVSPKYAVITCSEKNPAETKTLDLLRSKNIEYYLTDENDVVTYSDGSRIWVEYSKPE